MCAIKALTAIGQCSWSQINALHQIPQPFNYPETKKGQYVSILPFESGAGEESRTLDLNLGKVALYQLSYSRIAKAEF